MESVITVNGNEELFSSPTLREITIRYFVAHPSSLLPLPKKATNSKLLPIKGNVNAKLPIQIWEEIVENWENRKSADYLSLIISINKNFSCGLGQINLSGCTNLKDDDLRTVMQCYPHSLEIHNCPLLTKKSVFTLNEFGRNLESLHIGNSTQILPIDINSWLEEQRKAKEPHGVQKLAREIRKLLKVTRSDDEEDYERGLFQTPNLKKLIIWELSVVQKQQVKVASELKLKKGAEGDTSEVNVEMDYWRYLTKGFINNLEYLDVSSCQGVSNLNFLLHAKDTLRVLRLQDVLLEYDERFWGILRNLPKLKFLDVSQYNELASMFANPDSILDKIVTSLPNLTALDISGTNLAGFPPENSLPKCGLNGLVSRIKNPLNFLGLLTCHYSASDRQNIPALKIAGSATMEQIIIALKHYMQQGNMLRKVIRILLNKLVESDQADFVPYQSIMDLLQKAMRIHIEDKGILIISTAATFQVLKRLYNLSPTRGLGDFRKTRLISTLLRIMQNYPQDMSVLRNGVVIFVVLSSWMIWEAHLEQIQPIAQTLLNIAMNAALSCDANSVVSQTFFIKSAAHLIGILAHDGGPNVERKLRSIAVIGPLCNLIGELMRKNLLDHLSMFWMILNRITDCCNYPKTCNILLRTDAIKMCFQFIKLCNDCTFLNEGRSAQAVLDLFKTQISILCMLTNFVSNCSEDKSLRLVITSSNIEEAIRVLDQNFLQRSDKELLLHFCCGFLATVSSKADEHLLSLPCEDKILQGIASTVPKLEFAPPLDFTFRNLRMLYEILDSDSAAPVHFWALKTLTLLLITDRKKFEGMIIKDGNLTVQKLQEVCSRCDDDVLKSEFRSLCSTIQGILTSH